MTGVSFVVPVCNGARWIREALAAILAESRSRSTEIIVVDDGGDDGSSELIRALEHELPIRRIDGPRRGAAAAVNTGVRAARFDIVCQIDQDVIVQPGWLQIVVDALGDSRVAAAQGRYIWDPAGTVYARVMGLDLEQRYAAMKARTTSHVCTGNVAYRVETLQRVGLFDEALGYGYDNDISYRLREAGYELRYCEAARSLHRWREGLSGYLAQQYGFGYGRLDLVAKHPARITGDSVSPVRMMAHPVLMLTALVLFLAAAAMAIAGGPWRVAGLSGVAIIAGLALERFGTGITAMRRFHTATPLLFPVFHLARDLAWVAAILVWSVRKLFGRGPRPSHSMRPRFQD